MKTVLQIDKEIAATKKMIAKLESDKSQRHTALIAARTTREQNALSAMEGDNPESKAALIKACNEQRSIELELENVDFAIAAAGAQLEALTLERERAHRAEAWAEFQKVSELAIAQAAEIDKIAKALADVIASHDKTLRTLTDLSNRAGLPTTNFRVAHMRRSLENSLSEASRGEWPRHKEFAEGYRSFLQGRLDAIGNRADAAQPESEHQQTA